MSSSDSTAGKIVPIQDRAFRTRAALLEATEKLVAEEGIDAVTTTRIAAAACLSVGTLYRYFADREALLLGAYDATVQRIVSRCAAQLAALPGKTPAPQAARVLLGVYLEAAEAIPAHSGLLKAMRSIRPVEAEEAGDRNHVVHDIVAPFLARFAPDRPVDPPGLHLLNVLLGTLVDLYLVTPDPSARARLREDVEAHMLLALKRALGQSSGS